MINQFFKSLPVWNIQELTGYEPQTTFWQDFSIADRFGISSVKDTYKRAFKEWKNNHIYLTELSMVLNHKIFAFFETNRELAKVYNDLWMATDQYAVNNLKGEELSYYYRVTD